VVCHDVQTRAWTTEVIRALRNLRNVSINSRNGLKRSTYISVLPSVADELSIRIEPWW
jgi:hypothetical protein